MRFLGVLLDRTFALLFTFLLLKILNNLTFKNLVLGYIIFDFLYYVVFRGIVGQTAGDIIFGVFWKTGNFRIPKLFLRWLAGYMSPIFAFLPHITALSGERGICDVISGVRVERV